MNIEPKKLKIEIFNDQYSLVSDENEQDIIKASQLVDLLMKEIADKSDLHDGKKIAVLAALRMASRIVNLENSLLRYENKQRELADIIDKTCPAMPAESFEG